MKNLALVATMLSLFVLGACNTTNQKAKTNSADTLLQFNTHQIIYEPVVVCNKLSSKVNEQSGLLWYNNLFWANNDSDCKPHLYAYNKAGTLKKKVKITNAKNRDWEDLAEDSEYIYIGDFGNNYGDRKNLRVLIIRKSDISSDEKSTIEADKINFEWANQKNFSRRKHSHNFDCEAFFAYGDSLYFFTKNWDNHKTNMYAMPKTKGHYKLEPKAELDVNFLVTAADISSDGKLVALVGYKDYKTYMVLLYDFKNNNFLNGKQLRVDMSPLGGAQTESVVFGESDSVYISTEETNLPHSLFKVEWERWKQLMD